MIDASRLLTDLQGQVRHLEADLAEQVAADEVLAGVLRDEHAAERRARRTAAEWPAWRDAQLTQVAVAWVLGTVFLRWSEDNGLIDPVLSGPGARRAHAEDAQLDHFRAHPEHHDGDWLAKQFEVLRATDAGRLLFDPEHNPAYALRTGEHWVPPGHDAAKRLIAFWRETGADGQVRRDFTDEHWDTRFLGDLYQDLSEDAKKRYALLQTPRFVERFILRRTLDPAVEEFGVDGLRLIDPACGSGHFLLGAFARLVEAWREESPGLDGYTLARRACESVHGVDTNPFAVAIARFRLFVAALQVAGVATFAEAAGQRWPVVIGCGDSLLPLERQESFTEVDEMAGYRARWEDVHEFADEKLLHSGTYHVVVANPPYITVKDPEQSAAYRERWSACHRQFQLTVPFAQRIFDLARRPGADGLGSGHTGQITSNAFMKREFGTKLIEEFLPGVELSHVIDTSGAYIPGHGTPTVILIGRRGAPSRRGAVRAVLGVRGEPGQPDDPEKGLVWTAIEAQVDHPGSESDWVSVVDLPRERLAGHPWSLSGGGASELLAALESGSATPLATELDGRIGFASFPAADEVFFTVPDLPRRLRMEPGVTKPVILGDLVRDWEIAEDEIAVAPYGADFALLPLDPASRWARYLWPNRRVLQSITGFGGETRLQAGEPWWSWYRWVPARYRELLSIAFAFVSTHNHFVLDRGGKVFKQSAPVIKLPAGAGEDRHLELLGVLNSSTACFWLKQVCFPKGGSGIGRGIQPEDWMERFEFNGTNLEGFPLPADLPLARARHLDSLAQRLAATTPAAVAERAAPTRDTLAAARVEYDRLRAEMISAQEELDWDVYRRYGLLTDAEAAQVLGPRSAERDAVGDAEPLALGERAFEIVLARKVAAGQAETQWFARHGSTPIVGPPAHWSQAYRRTVEARIALIERRRDLALIERPECKRRWGGDGWDALQELALRGWLLDRCEDRALWFAVDDNGEQQPAPQTVRSLADRLLEDKEFGSVAALWAGQELGRPDAELAEILGALLDAEHVPFLAAYRYKPAGLAKRAEWEHTWGLQRREDAIAARMGHGGHGGADVTDPEVRREIAREIGDVPVPPKYAQADFLRGSYWSHRNKLDVAKERFVSYPAATRDGDGSLLLGWAGWDHREQAQALAVLVSRRRAEDGWDTDRVLPLLAGLAEVLPWVQQWHPEPDPLYGTTPAEIYDGFLDSQLGELRVSRDQLARWRPDGRVNVAPLPGRRTGAQLGGPTAQARGAGSRRPRSAPDPAHADAVLTAAATEPLSNERIRELTGLDAAAARALAKSLVADGRLTTTGQRRGMRYLLPDAGSAGDAAGT
ncbi:BREX-2 system adenine-specific DNA-methyltransferase PglX [Pseudonocardia sp.]|uniref:BREX-2 system adenine-specific DNA-methyltransferase PglX n=1 Tax=Pseudonocardia sp. TaxID=60912 RepID=UPI00260AAE4A|nr:BREX-2 system adenine-specific DNA-methyltransferase PglX [Pseudonocardia sp.]